MSDGTLTGWEAGRTARSGATGRSGRSGGSGTNGYGCRGRPSGRPAPRADPTPPPRMHRQRDLGMRGASWVLGAWSGGAHAGSAGGLLVLAHLGQTWLQEHTERPESRKRPKKVHRISDWSTDAERTFFGPSTPAVPCASRNPPAESAGPRLGAGFQDAAREARDRSLRVATLPMGRVRTRQAMRRRPPVGGTPEASSVHCSSAATSRAVGSTPPRPPQVGRFPRPR